MYLLLHEVHIPLVLEVLLLHPVLLLLAVAWVLTLLEYGHVWSNLLAIQLEEIPLKQFDKWADIQKMPCRMLLEKV